MKKLIKIHGLFLLLSAAPIIFADELPDLQTPLDAKNLSKYLDPLPVLPQIKGYALSSSRLARKLRNPLKLTVSEFSQQILPSNFTQGPFKGKTVLWGYNNHYPGPTITAIRGIPLLVLQENNLQNPVLGKYLPLDQTLHWADPFMQMGTMTPYRGPIPIVTHLHGGEVESASDGYPDAWFTPSFNLTGTALISPLNHYPNKQEAATLWYHDHALGITRLNVYAGLAGVYLIRDEKKEPANLPKGEYEREIVIQDRKFDTNGQLYFNREGNNPLIHPFWDPEFFGDTIVVNGKAWPYLQVRPARYRLRLVNISNARFYKLSFENNLSFWQIGTDGGLLDTPVEVKELILAPAERADVIVDFQGQKEGEKFILKNIAPAPFPDGDPVDPETTGQVMQFRVIANNNLATDMSLNPADSPAPNLRPRNPIQRLAQSNTLGTEIPVRHLTLNEVMSNEGKPTMVLLNNSKWVAPISENPRVGSTEIWEIINLTMDSHPIHLHLIQFQLLGRQKFDVEKYTEDYNKAFPGGNFLQANGPPQPYNPFYPGGNPDITPYLQGKKTPPDANENGWKDTIRVNHGEIARIIVRFAPMDVPIDGSGTPRAGINLFPFTPYLDQGEVDPITGYSAGAGYVWHCHILDHEDNEMMRPYKVTR